MSIRFRPLAVCCCALFIHLSGVPAEDIPFQAGLCADRSLTETDGFAGATGGRADRILFTWGGGTLSSHGVEELFASP